MIKQDVEIMLCFKIPVLSCEGKKNWCAVIISNAYAKAELLMKC